MLVVSIQVIKRSLKKNQIIYKPDNGTTAVTAVDWLFLITTLSSAAASVTSSKREDTKSIADVIV